MLAADPHCAMLSDLSRCAYRLGVGFGAAAEGEADWARKLECFQLFDRCFFAVRVATALELRLGRMPGTAPAEVLAAGEDLRDRADPPEEERTERDADADAHSDADRERDRDRETERASLPVLLRTLEGVAADAAALPGPEPSALPTLRELLAHVAAAPSAAPTSPPPKAALRARLAGSGATIQLATGPPRPPLGPDARRATGPPRP